MERHELILAAMVPCGGHRFTPVQIQKLLFLIDRQIPEHVGGPYFNFEPYHYGPFDRAVYQELEALADRGFVAIDITRSLRTFALTAQGDAWGKTALNELPAAAQDFIARAANFVRVQSFSSLVSSIYKAFPEMRENSVFQS